MKFAVYAAITGELADVRLLAELAAAAENAGFDGFFIYDNLLPSAWPNDAPTGVADVQIALTAIALATARIRFGAMVTPLPRRRPVKFAREVLSLDRASDGRIVIGAGSGAEARTEFEQLGEPSDLRSRAARLDETLQVLDGLLRGEEVSFTGEHVVVERTRLVDPRSQQPRVPIWVAAVPDGPRALRRAARWDGVFILPGDFSLMSPDDVAAARDRIMTHRDSDAPFDIAVAASFPDNTPEPTPDVVAAYERAGATLVAGVRLTLQQARDLIARGRPQMG